MRKNRMASKTQAQTEPAYPINRKDRLMSLLRENLEHHGDVPTARIRKFTGVGAKGYEAEFEEPYSQTKTRAVRDNQLNPPPKRLPATGGDGFFTGKARKPGNPLNIDSQIPPMPVDLYTYEPVVKKAKKTKLGSSDLRKVVVIPDTHMPMHDAKALSAVITFIEDFKPDTVVILGDWFDFEAVSRWDPVDLDTFSTMEELIEGTRGLEQIRRAAGDKCEIIFIEGNHEDRLSRYMIANCRELYGITDITRLTKMDVLNIKYVPVENQPLRFGDIDFLHGSFTNKYHAAKHADVYRRNVVYGHVHDIQRMSFPDPGGEPIMGLSLGCLAKKEQKYIRGRPTNWKHALGVFYFNKEGGFTDHVVPIVDGTFVFDGIVYEGTE